MRKAGICVCIAVSLMMMGCAMPYMPGILFSDMAAPVEVTHTLQTSSAGSKTGEAQMVNYLGWIAQGDASVEAAAKAGGITKIKNVDYKYNNILGIVQKTTTVVTGD